MSLYEYHKWGGMPFMVILDLLLGVIVAMIISALLKILSGRPIFLRSLDTMKQLGGLALIWGIFSSMGGLFLAFQAIELTPENIPLQVIAGGLKANMYTVLYGFGIFFIAQIAYLIIRSAKTNIQA